MNSIPNPDLPVIPEYITVHLGPPDRSAPNVRVPYIDYLANVASSEIYPTWPENAIRANIYAENTFALNRIYTEYYRSRGYDFDITSSTAYDQYFVDGRVVFENILELAGELFNSYVVRQGSVEPLFTQYCNGTSVTCGGLSQWGTVALAEQGLTPYEILSRYYGSDINIRTNVPVGSIEQSAPRIPLRLGAVDNDVRTLQIRLNRIGRNYPSIPKIPLTDGIFSYDTEAAVLAFQRIVGLTPDGIVGSATWYSVLRYFNAVKRLNELDSEGLMLADVSKELPEVLSLGSRGNGVSNLQFFLDYLSAFYSDIPPLDIDGAFGPSTEAAVRAAQRRFGLSEDGVVGAVTWNAIYNAYLGIIDGIPIKYIEGAGAPYPGVSLRLGSESGDVLLLQRYLNRISEAYGEIPRTGETGYYGEATEASVEAFQALFGLEVNGVVGALTWNMITDVFDSVSSADRTLEGQFPGYEV